MGHHEYELKVSNIEEIKQQLAELRQTVDAAIKRRHFCVSGFPR